ncbi:ATP-binding protein [Paracoccus sp. (in: a-proteobacteria)]|uniref:ATP-binding protein n=1 Tax=Paracoccus sp. TaxID=267 RepID=UPI003A8C55F1
MNGSTFTSASGQFQSRSDAEVNLRRLSKSTLIAFLSLILVGVTAGYFAISTLVQMQGLTYAATMRLESWRFVADRTLLLLRLEERHHDGTPLARLAQRTVGEAYDQALRSHQAENAIVNRLDTGFMEKLGLFDFALLNEFVRQDIDPQLRLSVQEVMGKYIDPRTKGTTDKNRLYIALQNDEFLAPLYRRATLAGIMSQQCVRPLVYILLVVVTGFVLALWLLWTRSLAPAFAMLDQRRRSLLASTTELADRNAELSRKNAQVLAAQRMAHICYWFRDGDGAASFSAGFEDVLGLRHQDLPTTPEALARLSEEAEAEKVLTIYRRLSRSDGSEEVTRTIQSRDFGRRVIRERIESRLVGGRRQMMGIMFDISDVARASEGWANSEKIEMMELISAGVAHDFNNILNIILAHAEIMLEERRFSESRTTAIQDAAQTAAAITAQLRSRVAFSDGEPSRLCMAQVVGDCVKSLTKATPEGPRIVMRVAEGENFMLLTTRGLFENAIINVISNAREASRPGQAVEVVLDLIDASELPPSPPGVQSPAPAPRYGRILVIDHGRGMSEAIRKRAVEPFFSTKDRGAGSKGRGLGLWSVFSFMQSVQGQLSIVSREGVGSAVSLIFPLNELVEPCPIVARPHVPDSKCAVLTRVLIIEDEDHLAEIAETMVRMVGCQPVVARSAHEALHLDRQFGPFDILFTDVTLGAGFTGLDVAEQLTRRHHNMKVIVASGFLSRPEFDALNAHDWRFLQKPYSLAQVRKTFAAMIGTSHAPPVPDLEVVNRAPI